ncbi:hypothetical protein N9L20_05485 [Flavobacteriaceae bacterium]|nr:hypothetical protein [Flavobacteriaceae bacterium]
MAIEGKDPLFQLIKSLSKSEKRQFKLYVGRLEVNSNANFLALFNIMEKLDRYDERVILGKTKIVKRQLSNAKAHLYKQILISLRLSPLHKNTRSTIREQMDFASILYNKGLYKQSLKILDKAKNLALNSNELNLAYEIVELEKLIESQYITHSLNNRADLLSVQAKELSIRNVFTSKMSNISLQLYSLFLKEGYAKNDQDLKRVNDYFEARIPRYNFEDLGFSERLFLFQANLWRSLIVQDFISSYKFAQKWVNLYEIETEMKKLNPVFYLKGVNYLLESLFYLRHKRFYAVLNQLEEEVKEGKLFVNDNTKSLVFQYVYQHRINAYFIKGEFTKGLSLIPGLLGELNQYKGIIDEHHIMVFYYKIACMYFGAGDNENCIYYLDKIIKNKELKIREDLLCFTRVLNLVSHYESGKDEHIEELIKSTYQFLIKMNELHKVQQLMIGFLRNLNNLYPHELKGAFKDLYSELKPLRDHPYEGRAFLYLDILSWLESHIKGIPVEQVVKSKLKN